jgi:hypothetical protein
MPSAVSADSASPVMASTPAGIAACTRAASSSSGTPSSPRTTTRLIWPGSVSTSCAVATSKATMVAPARPLLSPKVKMPTTSTSRSGPFSSTCTRSPTCTPPSCAVSVSTATSVGPSGPRPSSTRRGDSTLDAIQLTPRDGASPLDTTSPSVPTSCA